MATANLSDIKRKWALALGLPEDASNEEWEAKLRAELSSYEAKLKGTRMELEGIWRNLKKKCDEIKAALLVLDNELIYARQTEYLGKILQAIQERDRVKCDLLTVGSPENTALLPKPGDALYEAWLDILSKKEAMLGLAPPPSAPAEETSGPAPGEALAVEAPPPENKRWKVTTMVAVAVLLLTGSLAWPILHLHKRPLPTTAAFIVKSQPAADSITINGGTPVPAPASGKFIVSNAGSYELVVWVQGYLPKSNSVSIKLGETQTIDFGALEQPWAYLNVGSSPGDAEIYVDGSKQLSNTPVSHLRVTPGVRLVEVRKNGHFASKTLSLEAGEIADIGLAIQTALQTPLQIPSDAGTAAKVTVKSDPSGATLSWRSGSTGEESTNSTTPAELDLQPGGYFVTGSLEGYQTNSQFVCLKAGIPQIVNLKMLRATALLSVLSDPEGAAVYVDDMRQPEDTPALNLPVTQGWHHIKVTLGGYPPCEHEVAIRSANPVEQFSFIPQYSKVSVSTSPNGAQVWVDNRLMDGLTPEMLLFLPGVYTIVLRYDGYEDEIIRNFKVGVGQHPQLIRTLQPKQVKYSDATVLNGAAR